MSPRSVHLVLALGFVSFVASLAACGDTSEEPAIATGEPAVEETVDDSESGTGGRTMERYPEGAPMPEADEAGGIPPYPNAIAWGGFPADEEGYISLRAFTTDSWDEVLAFYDERLADWQREEFLDMVMYVKALEEAAVTVSPVDWDPPPDTHPVLRDARTAIGTTWR